MSADPEGWRRSLWLMVAVQFMMSLALTVFAPILPLYLRQLGIHDAVALDWWCGILNSVNFLFAALLSPLWGMLADRSGRKAMVLRSSLAICFFTALMGFSSNVWQLLALRALMGVFSGFAPTAIALVATQVPEQRLGFSLGWLSTGQLVGALMGPLVGGLIADLAHDYRAVFFWTAVIAALAATIVAGLVHESFTRTPTRRDSVWQQLRKVFTHPAMLPLFFLLLLAQFSVRSAQPVVTLFVEQLTGPVAGLATLAGVAFAITGLSDLVASPLLGKRSDTLGYRRVLIVSLAGGAACSLPQAFVHSYPAFLLARLALGVFIGGLLPTANALIGRLVPAANRGLTYGLSASALLLGNFGGPFLGGAVAALAGIRSVFVMTAVMLLLGLGLVLRFVPEFRAGTATAK